MVDIGSKDLPTLIKAGDHEEVLRFLRTKKLREPALAVDHGKALLKASQKSPLGGGLEEGEYLAVIEQVLLASLDLNDLKFANTCLKELKNRFGPDSARVRRLIGLCFEADGDLKNAMATYEQMLTTNPSSAFALKRKYCILKAQPEESVNACDFLVSYLENFGGDAGAWKEMGELCLDIGDYMGAVYCWEELILANPLDSGLHCHLGELYATLGGLKNLKAARKHFAQALDLDASNIRALYALVAVAAEYLDKISASSKKIKIDEHDVEVAKELVRYGASKVCGSYSKKGGRLYQAVAEVMGDYMADC